MFKVGTSSNTVSSDVMEALDKSLAIIEFTPEGKILNANKNFLSTMGYSLADIQDKHHRLFVPPEDKNTEEYKTFWKSLSKGEHFSAAFKRIGANQRQIWIQATYNPVLDRNGRVSKVIKFATDITQEKLKSIAVEGQIDALNRSQAVIQFKPDGTIVEANENFLGALGYSRDEIVGKNHSMFVSQEEKGGPEYQQFWNNLRAGKFQQAEYLRLGKNGREVWIQATYNPIIDDTGKVINVVKFATDITEDKKISLLRRENQTKIDADLVEISAKLTATAQQTNSVAAASSQASSAVSSVAAGSEELSASASEIAQQLHSATEATREAVQTAHTTNKVVMGLTESARKISDVISLINDIADQTNLLALNATIEAARAGEAGKGFAVVANEVKNLAIQSSKATVDISSQISHVQLVSGQAADAINTIAALIKKIDDVATAVSSAVEEQTSVTAEMTRTMHDAAEGVATINESIRDIAKSSEEIETATRNVRQLSAQIA